MDQATPRLQSWTGRYTGVAQALHWLTALFMLAILPVAWVMVTLPRGNDERALLFVIHRSIGITIVLIVAARLAWRATHPAPPRPGDTSRAIQVMGRATHWVLYALLVVMPVSGYLQSGNGHPVSYFGLFDIPGFAENTTVDAAAEWVHLTGQWLVYALVALHVAATAWHVAIRRDGLLSRMLPTQDRRV